MYEKSVNKEWIKGKGVVIIFEMGNELMSIAGISDLVDHAIIHLIKFSVR